MRRAALRGDQRGAVALEFALTFPVVLLAVFGLFAAYSLIMTKRAMDVGVEKALRFAIVNAGGGTSGVTGTYANWARPISAGVGSGSVVTVTPAAFTVGAKVTVTATYAWIAPATIGSPANPLFNPVTLTSSATMRVMH